MITIVCDSCGHDFDQSVEGVSAVHVMVNPPRKPKDSQNTLAAWFQEHVNDVEKRQYDLCRECGMALMVTLGQRRLDRRLGRAVERQ